MKNLINFHFVVGLSAFVFLAVLDADCSRCLAAQGDGVSPGDSNRLTNATKAMLFAPRDFNGTLLAKRIKERAEPVSKYLWALFSTTAKETLESSTYSEDTVKVTLANELNRILVNESLLTSEHFSGTNLSSAARVLSLGKPARAGRACLNRVLLETAFSDEISGKLELLLEQGSGRLVVLDSSKRLVSMFENGGHEAWSTDVLNSIQGAIVGKPEIRRIEFVPDGLSVIVGKHDHFRISGKDGAVTALGSD